MPVQTIIANVPGGIRLTDPVNPSVLHTATQWIADILQGQLATSIAIIAIAWLGFLMLMGQIDIKRSILTVLGCFLLFGAPVIARGVNRIASPEFALPPESGLMDEVSPDAITVPSKERLDPYAGASLR